jgi:hypothetical protein
MVANVFSSGDGLDQGRIVILRRVNASARRPRDQDLIGILLISETMPVVVGTHNSTVGASVGADYLLFARNEVKNGEAVYRIYSGHPTDKSLSTVDGKSIGSHETMMDSLEAGAETDEDRRQGYEAIKN